MSLEYDISCHLRCQIRPRSGRSITLESLHQEMTYAGLIAGLPSSDSNDREIEQALRAAQAQCFEGTTPHLISPPRRDYLRTPGDMSLATEQSSVPEWLPMVRCIASFKDVTPVRDPDKHLSVLTVIWYQDEYALPIAEAPLSQLQALDWDSLAVDVEL